MATGILPNRRWLILNRRAMQIDYVDRKIALCESNPGIRFLCIQGLEMCRKEDREKLFSWLDRKLGL